MKLGCDIGKRKADNGLEMGSEGRKKGLRCIDKRMGGEILRKYLTPFSTKKSNAKHRNRKDCEQER